MGHGVGKTVRSFEVKLNSRPQVLEGLIFTFLRPWNQIQSVSWLRWRPQLILFVSFFKVLSSLYEDECFYEWVQTEARPCCLHVSAAASCFTETWSLPHLMDSIQPPPLLLLLILLLFVLFLFYPPPLPPPPPPGRVFRSDFCVGCFWIVSCLQLQL